MKKNFSLLIVFILLSGCFGSIAFLGPASTTVASSASGNIARGAFTSSVSYGIKKQTGKLPSEHVIAYAKKGNKELKDDRCIKFIEATKSKTCEALNKKIDKTKIKIAKVKKSIFDKSKLEDLAKKSGISRR